MILSVMRIVLMKKSIALLTALPLTLALTACGTDGSGSSKPQVVASFYPLQYVVEQVGGDFVDVSNLTTPGAEPHDLELKPQQVAAVQDADVVVYEKDFQAAVDEAIDQADRPKASTVDVTSELTLLDDAEHADDEGHDHADVDPHVWLDPQNMVTITAEVEKALVAADPAHEADYAANAKALTDEMTTLDSDFEAGLASCKVTSIVTSHAAFAYLAERYGLTQIPIAGIDPSSEPSAGQLADITQLVRSKGITTIFTEELVSPAIAKTVADETGVTTATLDPIEGLSDETSDDTYLTLMRNNLAELQKANDCS